MARNRDVSIFDVLADQLADGADQIIGELKQTIVNAFVAGTQQQFGYGEGYEDEGDYEDEFIEESPRPVRRKRKAITSGKQLKTKPKRKGCKASVGVGKTRVGAINESNRADVRDARTGKLIDAEWIDP